MGSDFEILLPPALISQGDFRRSDVTTRMSVSSLSLSLSLSLHHKTALKSDFNYLACSMHVAIKCCQHFTMVTLVCCILPSGLLQPPSPMTLCLIGMTSGCLTQQVRNIARRCRGTQQQLQGVHIRIFCYLLQPPLMVKSLCVSLRHLHLWFTNVCDEMRWDEMMR